jgi:hypothetical protein
MKLYRITHYIDGGSSGGFSWETSVEAAKRTAAEYKRNNPDELDSEIEPVEFEPTKAGILALLRQYAQHADNG